MPFVNAVRSPSPSVKKVVRTFKEKKNIAGWEGLLHECVVFERKSARCGMVNESLERL